MEYYEHQVREYNETIPTIVNTIKVYFPYSSTGSFSSIIKSTGKKTKATKTNKTNNMATINKVLKC